MALRRYVCDVISKPVVWAGWVESIWWFLKIPVICSCAAVKCSPPPRWVEKTAWEGVFLLFANALSVIREREKKTKYDNVLIYRLAISWKQYPMNWQLFWGCVDQVQSNLNKGTRELYFREGLMGKWCAIYLLTCWLFLRQIHQIINNCSLKVFQVWIKYLLILNAAGSQKFI